LTPSTASRAGGSTSYVTGPLRNRTMNRKRKSTVSWRCVVKPPVTGGK
jgi:hypothetical protein